MGLFDVFKSRKGNLHPLAAEMLSDVVKKNSWEDVILKGIPSGREFLDLSRESQWEVAQSLLTYAASVKPVQYGDKDWTEFCNLTRIIRPVFNRQFPFSDAELGSLLQWLGDTAVSYMTPYSVGVKALENFCANSEPSAALFKVADRLRGNLSNGDAGARKQAARIAEAIKVRAVLPLVEGDVWAEQAIEDLKYLEDEALDDINLSPEEAKAFNKGGTGIFSLTVYADKPGAKQEKTKVKLSEIQTATSCTPESGCC